MYQNKRQIINFYQFLQLCVLSLLLPIVGQTQSLTPFECVPNFYQSIGSEGTFVRYNVVDFSEGFDTIATLGFAVNALAYHPDTDFMYAIQNDNKHLIKIGNGGEFEDLGAIGLPDVSLYVGEIDPDGNYFIKGIENEIYKINLNDFTYTTITTIELFSAADWAYNYTDDKIYGVRETSLYAFDPQTNIVTVNPLTGFEPGEANGFGAAFYTVDGSIYIHNNTTGNIYKVDIATFEVAFIIKGPDLLNGNDGASCPFALPPFPVIYAENDVEETPMNTPIDIEIKDNDDVHFAIIDNQSFQQLENPLHGTTTFNANNAVLKYTPNPNFYGIDSLQYQFCDQSYPDFCDDAWVYIYVTTSAEVSVEICQNDTYTFGQQTLSQAGVYEATFLSSQAVDSTVTLNLSILPPVETNLAETICNGEVYQVGNSFYTQSGNYTDVLTNYLGCDSTVNLVLNVLSDIETNLAETICDGDVYQVGNSVYNQSGNYTDVLTNYLGCDSTVNLVLNVLSDIETNLAVTICEGEVYAIGHSVYNQSGNYTDILTNFQNCDSTINLTLTVVEEIETNLYETICEGEVYQVGNSFYTQSGNYTDVLTNFQNCDSTINLTLTVVEDIETNLYETICEGEVYQVGNSFYNQSGNYTDILTSFQNCDSTVNLVLNVLPEIETNLAETICDGEVYQVGNSFYTQSGNYTDVLTNYLGCDSTVNLVLNVLPEIETNLAETICNGEVYQVGNSFYNQSGNYTDVLTSFQNCDSTVHLTLTVIENLASNIDTVICEGDVFEYNQLEYVETTTFDAVLTSIDGCDSTVTVNLTVQPFMIVDIQAGICEGESYSFNGELFSTTGYYSATLTDQYGCDSVVVLNLQVTENIEITLTETICEGNTYTVGNNTYDATGTYVNSFTANGGCDSVVVLNLEVLENAEVDIEVDICAGESYQLGNSTFTESGNYTAILSDNNNCDSIVNLALTVLPYINTNLEQTICEGESYQVGNSVYTQSGDYSDVLPSFNGCDSLVNLSLNVLPTVYATLDTTICEGAFLEYNNISYSEPATFTTILSNQNGCDSVLTVNLSLHYFFIRDIHVGICAGESYDFGGTIYTEDGIYTQTFTDLYNCDSIVVLVLQVNESINITLNESICEGESYIVGDNTYLEAGTYTNMFTANGGCDSLVTLNLTVSPHVTTNLEATICAGETYQIGDSTYHQSGNYQEILTAHNGCDSSVHLALMVLENATTNLAATLCEGETYQVGNVIYTESGNYTHILTNTVGCDSTVHLVLNVLSDLETNLAETICEGTIYQVGNSSYAQSGNYTDILTTAEGCDSTVHLVLNVVETIYSTLDTTICEGQVFEYNQVSYTESTSFETVLTTQNGCENILTINLNVHSSNMTTTVEAGICTGNTYEFNGNSYQEAGTYTATFSDQYGCDSMVVLNLQINENINITLDRNICAGETYIIGDSTYFTTGTYMNSFVADGGCDSLVTLNLTVSSPTQHQITTSICAGEMYQIGDSTYTQNGNYSHIVSNENGCDSTINLTLEVLPIIETQLNIHICEGETYQVGDSTYTQSGNYTDILSNENGCDSIVMTNLTTHISQNTNLQASICIGETYEFNGLNYTESGNYNAVYTDQFGCDSTIVLMLEVTENIAITLDRNICAGETYIIGDSTYFTTGTYMNSFVADGGCDSLVTLNLTVSSPTQHQITTSICAGEMYQIGDSTYTQNGNYSHIVSNENGCDSTINLTLEVLPIIETQLNIHICEGETYQVGDSTYTQSGNYTDILSNENGCDSIVMTNLTTHISQNTNLQASICIGETYEFNGLNYTESGNYNAVYTDQFGCDSTVVLMLEVTENIAIILDENICAGQTFNLGNNTYDVTGTYTYNSSTNGACDTMITLNLIVSTLDTTNIEATICEGETYQIGTANYTESGNYTQVLTTDGGCDSMINLNLTILPALETQLEVTICEGKTYQIDTAIYTQSGNYTQVLMTNEGCDSIINLNLTILSTLDTTNIEATICESETYQIGTSIYTQSGNYTDTLLSSNGCDSLIILDLIVNKLPEFASIETENPTDCDGQNAMIIINPIGDNNNYLYSIDQGNTWQDSPVFENLGSGIYQPAISYIDDSCTQIYAEDIVINSIENLSISLLDSYPPLCYGEANAGANVAASGGYDEYRFTWSNGNETAELSNALAGNYAVTVQDAEGCETILEIEIPDAPIFDIQLTETLDTTLCLGQTATFNAGMPEHDYEWRNAQGLLSTAPEITVTESGLYTVTAINENNCIATDSVVVVFTEEFFKADFLLPTEGLIGEPIVAIEVSFPIPDSIRWEYSQDSILQEQNIKNQEIMTFPHTGSFDITMYAYRGECEIKVTKTIHIFETIDELLNPDNLEPGYTQILEFTLFPTPNDGRFEMRVALSDKTPISLHIFREDGMLIDERSLSGNYLYLEKYALTGLQSGVYAAILQTASEWRYFTFVVH